MQFRILDRLEILGEDGTALCTSAPLVRQLICVLALYANEHISTERIMSLLWESYDADLFRGRLRTCIYQARRAIGQHRIVTERGAYRLCIEPDRDSVDLNTFRELAQEGVNAIDRGDQHEAVRLLQQAADLWPDAPLTDLPSTVTINAIAKGLLDEQRATLESLIRTRLQLGQHRQLVPFLRTKIASHPLDERLRAHLMVALYRSGRRLEALRTYDDVRSTLHRDLDATPGAELELLRQQIVNDAPELRSPQAVESAREIVAYAAERPPRSIEPTASADTELDDYPSRNADAAKIYPQSVAPRQLPSDIVDFVGREEEVHRLNALLTDRRTLGVSIVQIVGPPGTGKTSLAVHAAHLVRSSYPDGQFFVQMDERDAFSVLGELLRAFDIAPEAIPDSLSERASLWRSRLADHRFLLLIDNASDVRQVRWLIPGSAGCGVIVNGRKQLTGLESSHLINLEPLSQADAVEMLGRIVGMSRVASEPQAAARVACLCGRLPLAVRIAGARLSARPTWSLRYFASLLAEPGQQRLDELQTDDQALRASIAVSYDALDTRSKAAFRLLALAGPHDVAGWVISVLIGEPTSGDVVESLVTRSLLSATGIDSMGQPRYRLHDLLRDYSTEMMSPIEAEASRERLLLCWLELTDLAAAELPHEPYFPIPHTIPTDEMICAPPLARRLASKDAYAWFEVEYSNVVAAIRTACAAGKIYLAFGIALRLASYLHLQAYHNIAEEIWSLIASAAEKRGDVLLAARAKLRKATVIAFDRSQCERAVSTIDSCVAIFEQAYDHSFLSRSLSLRAYILNSLGKAAPARIDAERGLKLAESYGDAHAEFACLGSLGLAFSSLGDNETATSYCNRALVIARQLGEPNYEAMILANLADVHIRRQDYLKAVDFAAEAASSFGKIRNDIGEARSQERLGDAHEGACNYRSASVAYSKAIDAYLSKGMGRAAVLCRFKVVKCLRALGDAVEAKAHIRKCVREAEKLQMREELELATRLFA